MIKQRYLHKQKRSVQKICEEVAARCREQGVDAPHPNTIRRRIAKLPPQWKVRCREGLRQADETFGPRDGQYPQPTRPFEDMQIDHTKVDIILVDEVHRQPIGRPWITVAIDIFSRMVAGFYISLDPPGSLRQSSQCENAASQQSRNASIPHGCQRTLQESFAARGLFPAHAGQTRSAFSNHGRGSQVGSHRSSHALNKGGLRPDEPSGR